MKNKIKISEQYHLYNYNS